MIVLFFKETKLSTLFALLFVVIGCANGHCRKSSEVILPEGPTAATKAASERGNHSPNEKTILVFKYDGSLQCAQGTEKTLEAMSEELKGISVVTAEKRSDGLMRAQVCGQPTGRANVFEIYEKDFTSAKGQGFNPWTFY